MHAERVHAVIKSVQRRPSPHPLGRERIFTRENSTLARHGEAFVLESRLESEGNSSDGIDEPRRIFRAQSFPLSNERGRAFFFRVHLHDEDRRR